MKKKIMTVATGYTPQSIAPSSQLDSPSRAIKPVTTTAAPRETISSGVKIRSRGAEEDQERGYEAGDLDRRAYPVG